MTKFFAAPIAAFMIATMQPTFLCAQQALTTIDGFPIFNTYQDFRNHLDPLIKTRKVIQFIQDFGASGQYSAQQAAGLERQVRSVRPFDFQHVEVIRSENLSENWRQEILAYWTGSSYMFLYVMLQQREEGLFPVNVTFNTELGPLVAKMM